MRLSLAFLEYLGVPNGSGSCSDPKAVPELLNLSSPLLFYFPVRACEVFVKGWTLCELFLIDLISPV